MSASPSIDAYDAQMLDFSFDPDVPMNITGSAEFFAEALMDHDGHLTASTYSELASVEVDMEEYVGDNAEYEMADETAQYQRPHGDELLDIEVYDASHAPSPLVPPQPLHPSVEVPTDSEHPATTSPTFPEHAALPESQNEPESESHPVPLDHPATDVSHVEPSVSGEVVALGVASSEPVHPSDAPDESILPISESLEQLGDTARTDGQLLEVPASAGTADEAGPHGPPVAEEHAADSEVVQQENSEPPTAELAPLTEDAGAPVQDEKATDQVPATEEETFDPLHISDDVYIDPPPAVILSVANLSEPGFALFNPPDVDGESTEESLRNQKVYSLLLENRPTLYYEPLSSVFEALRQDEDLLSRVPHSFEGELVLDAYDLQLAVSEDNVHSREISLHDLNILHDGSDFAGPLRLFLRAIVPRFIIRYYALQEQIQHLHVAAEAGEGGHGEGHCDAGEQQPLPQQDETANHPSIHTAVAPEGSEVSPTTEGEEFVEEPVIPPDSTKEAPQENYEPQDTSASQEPSAEYHEVTEEATHTLEDENDYDGTNVGDVDESAKSDSLDADQIHDIVAKDIDALVTATGQESEFGGEQTEYLDYAQLEEYDERYGEDLSERAEGSSPVQYGEPPHYKEGEQQISTTVDETPAVLPGEDEDAEDESAATPIPARAVLELESKEPDDMNATDKSVLPKRENLALSSEGLATNESTNGVDHAVQPSGNQEPSTVPAKIFSEVEESDFNFVSMLEREADGDFDPTVSTEQSRQEGSIEPIPRHLETWDEDEWDDEDAEGVDEEDWIDPDVESNESSATLSSKASSKRSHDEVDPSDQPYVENPPNSPGSKRPRIQ